MLLFVLSKAPASGSAASEQTTVDVPDVLMHMASRTQATAAVNVEYTSAAMTNLD